MATNIYQATIEGRTITWTLTITNTNASSSKGTQTIGVVGDAKLVYGSPSGNDRGDYVLPSYMRVRVLDTDANDLYNELETQTSDKDFEVVLSEPGGDYEWHGFIRKDTAQRRFFPDLGYELIDVYVYDGVGLMKEENVSSTASWYIPAKPITELYAAIGNGKQADILWDLETNLVTTGKYARTVAINGYAYYATDGKTPSRYQVAEDILRSFDARMWLQFYNGENWSDFPRWCVARRRLMGQQTAASSRRAAFTDSTGVISTANPTQNLLNGPTSVTGANFLREARYQRLEGIKLVRVNTKVNPGTGDGLVYLNRRANYDAAYYTLGGGATTATDGGVTVISLDASSVDQYWEQDLIYLTRGTKQKWTISFQEKRIGSNDDLTFEVRNSSGTVASVSFIPTLSSGYNFVSQELEFVAPSDDEYSYRLTQTTGGIHYFKDINVATDKDSWTHAGVNGFGSIAYEINTQLANVRFSTTDDTNQPESFTDDRSPSFTETDLARVFRSLHSNMQDARYDLVAGEIIGLFPPELPFQMENSQGNNATYIVATGVEMDLRRETTKGTWHEHLDLT
jgi:hypothetical protein